MSSSAGAPQAVSKIPLVMPWLLVSLPCRLDPRPWCPPAPSVLAGVVVGVIGHADLPVAPGVQLVPVQAALAEQVTADGAHGRGLEADPARAAAIGQVHLLHG